MKHRLQIYIIGAPDIREIRGEKLVASRYYPETYQIAFTHPDAKSGRLICLNCCLKQPLQIHINGTPDTREIGGEKVGASRYYPETYQIAITHPCAKSGRLISPNCCLKHRLQIHIDGTLDTREIGGEKLVASR